MTSVGNDGETPDPD